MLSKNYEKKFTSESDFLAGPAQIVYQEKSNDKWDEQIRFSSVLYNIQV